MKKDGVKYVQVLGIDNILNKCADPLMVGYLVKTNMELVSKYTTKTSWDESVGMHVNYNGKPFIVEYSDMSEADKKKTNEDNSLVYGEGFLCTFMGTIEYFSKV